MTEYTEPGGITLEKTDHLVQPLIAHAQRRPGHPLLARRDGDRFVALSAAEVWDRVRRLARGLIALGIDPGDRVAILSATRLEWVLLDYAILAVRGVTVPIYETSSAEQVEWVLSDSGAVAVFVETSQHRATFEEVADRLPECAHAFVIEDGALDELARRGDEVGDEPLAQRLDGLTTEDLATIVYTSGTTGPPKGCRLTHGNLRWDVVNTVSVLADLITPADRQLLFLPLAHSFARILCLCSIERLTTVGFATSTDALTEELPIFRPTYLAAVPRIFEKVLTAARQRAEAAGRGAVFDRAADVAEAYSRARRDGGAGPALRAQHLLFDALVYRRIRAAFGGRLRAATSGGGPLGERLGHVFDGMGVQVYEGYGLTETSPVTNCNRPGAWRLGTVGRPIPGTSIRIADDGEVLVRGGQVFQGYHRNEEATSGTIDADGWLHTGDLGALDDDGYLRITGRKKELIVTAAGKNVAPAVLEERIQAHPLVSRAMVVGDDRPFVAALVTVDEDALPRWAEQHGKAGAVADLVDDPDLNAAIQEAVDAANRAVSRAEAVREFRILPAELTVEDGELTPTLKLKRRVVADRYADVIADLYAT